jgi:hypothetical protein
VVAAASVVMMAGLGSFNAWSVFRIPLADFYSANVTDVNTAFFVSSTVFGLVACGSALLFGRVGPRAVGVAGGIVYGWPKRAWVGRAGMSSSRVWLRSTISKDSSVESRVRPGSLGSGVTSGAPW